MFVGNRRVVDTARALFGVNTPRPSISVDRVCRVPRVVSDIRSLFAAWRALAAPLLQFQAT
jgi:hypothetical protein